MDTITETLNVSFDSARLAKAVSALQRHVLPSKTTLPVLTHVLLEASADGQVTVSASDLDVASVLTLEAEPAETGSIVLPGKLLAQVLKHAPAGRMTLTMKETSVPAGRPIDKPMRRLTATLAAENYRVRLDDLLHPDEFPTLAKVTWADTVEWPALSAALGKTAWAASNEESRPILNGVSVEVSADGATEFAATNGHRLSRVQGELKLAAPRTMNLPATFIRACHELLKGADEVQFGFLGGTFLGLRTPQRAVITRTVEGPFPNYRKVFPEGAPAGVLRFPRAAFELATKRADSLFSQRYLRRVKLALGPHVEMTATAGEAELWQRLPEAEWSGAYMEIGFNAGYLLECARYLRGATLEMSVYDPTRAMVITSPEEPTTQQLLMPLRLVD